MTALPTDTTSEVPGAASGRCRHALPQERRAGARHDGAQAPARRRETPTSPGATGPFPRIVHLVPKLFGATGVFGGAERYAFELARAMAETGADTTLVSFGDASRITRVGPLRIRVLGGTVAVRGQPDNPLAPGLFAALRRADVIHCHQRFIVASSLAAAFARLRGRRVFVSDLGGGGWDLSAWIDTGRWYHGFLHLSRYSREISGQANDPRAHVIYGGVDSLRFSPIGPRARHGSVLFVGRLLPHKGVDDLVRALPDGLALELVGRPYDERYHADLRRLAAGKRVTFRTDFDDHALIAAYRAASCIVLPSVYRTCYGAESRVPELLGQTLLEGMACGLPAICTDVASMPEIVTDGETGFVVPPNDPAVLGRRLRWLHDHPDDADRFGIAARHRVQNRFSWPQVARHCLAIYRGEP